MTAYAYCIYNGHMAKVTINIKADKKVKEQAQKTARELGMPLSAIVNAYLHQFIRTKTVSFYVPEGKLNPAAKRRLDRLAKEAREGKNVVGPFMTAGEMDAYLDSR